MAELGWRGASVLTTVSSGILHLEKGNNFNSIGGDLVIDGGAVWNEADHQLGSTNTVSFLHNGIYAVGAHTENLNHLQFDSGELQLPAAGGVTVNGDILVASGGGQITGTLALGAVQRVIDVAPGVGFNLPHAVGIAQNAVAGIRKLGAGTLYLQGANTFTGNITVEAGACYVTHSSALGLGGGTTSVSAGAVLYLAGSNPLNFASEVLLLAGKVYAFIDTIWSGNIQLSGTLSDFDGNATNLGPYTFTHTGIISGPGKLTKKGTSRLTLDGAAGNIYTGGTQLDGGGLYLGKTTGNAIPGNFQLNSGYVALTSSNQIVSTAAVTIDGGVLDMGSRSNTIGSLAGTGGEVKFALGSLITGNATNTTWHGLLSGHGSNSLIKQGSGIFTLNYTTNGGDTLTGPIIVNQGTLQMNGLHPGPIIVNIGGLLTGSGTVGQIQAVGGKVCLCALKTTNLIINGAGSEAITAITLGGYGHIVTSSAILTGSSLNASMNYVPYAGSSFMLIENTGSDPTVGTFSGLPEGAAVIFGTRIFNITYKGGTGNDVVLTLVSGGLPPLEITKFTVSKVPGSPWANAVLIEATGQPNVVHLIESSSDLTTWEVIDVIPGTSNAQGHSSTSFFDDGPRRFYRVKEAILVS